MHMYPIIGQVVLHVRMYFCWKRRTGFVLIVDTNSGLFF